MITKFIFAFFLFVSFNSFAHSGRTNSAGCHNVTKTGGYHCHNSGSSSSGSSSSGSSSSSSVTTSTENSQSLENNQKDYIIEIIDQEIEGIFETGFSGVVYKNIRCENYWKVDLVNRNNKKVYVKASFFTVDKDGDPLKSMFFPRTGNWLSINQTSRITLHLDQISCLNQFEKIRSSFNIEY